MELPFCPFRPLPGTPDPLPAESWLLTVPWGVGIAVGVGAEPGVAEALRRPRTVPGFPAYTSALCSPHPPPFRAAGDTMAPEEEAGGRPWRAVSEASSWVLSLGWR